MEPADPAARSSAIKTYSIAALLIIAGCAVFASYIDALLETSLTKAGEQIRNSAWALVAFFDASFGAVFAVYYVFIRNGPPVFGVPAHIFAFLWPFAANFALVWYISYMILVQKDLRSALFPCSDGNGYAQVPMRTEHNRVKSQIVMAVAAVLIAIICCLYVWAFGRESMREGIGIVLSKQYKWITFTFIDSLAGLLFVAIYIVEREGGSSITSVLWIVALFLIGNGVTFAYVVLMAMEALHLDVPFSQVVLSTKKWLFSGPTIADV